VSESRDEVEAMEIAAVGQVESVAEKPRQKRSSKAKSKTGKKARKDASGGSVREQAGGPEKSVRTFRDQAKKEIFGAFPQIVHTLIEQAKGGSVNHTKLLFDLGGVKEQAKAGSKRKGKAAVSPSLADLLLQELDRKHELEKQHEALSKQIEEEPKKE
jgi:hypothetical protein